MTVDAALDALYQAPLDAFTRTRSELAKDLKKTDSEGAARVKGIAKPSISAWAVNQLRYRAGAELRRAFEAGQKLREVQTGGEGGAAIAAAQQVLRRTIDELMTMAEGLLDEGGHPATEATMARVRKTLDALSAYGTAQPDPSAGRLSKDVDPPGFDAFASLALARPRPARTDTQIPPDAGEATAPDALVAPSPDEARQEERRLLETELREARDRHFEAVRRFTECATERLRAEGNVLKAMRGLDVAQSEARRAEEESEAAQRQAEGAKAEVERLEGALGIARGRA
ncbi:MAG: hypothetical protein U0166_11510 [Acidobacteriota bacterium]